MKVALRKVTECVSGVKVRRVTALVVVSALLCFEAKKEVTCSAVNSAVLVYDSTAID